MRLILTIAGLTWKAAFRYRLFWILAVLLISAVVGLPLLLKDDGSAQGLTQILLTYTLSAIASLLGFSTLWLSCSTMARDVEECQMQVVTVKPIARWQIWLGKWVGVVGLNLALLAISGACVYALLNIRARQLPAQQQAILNREIFVARASAKAPPVDIQAEIERRLAEFRKKAGEERINEPLVRQQIAQGILADLQVIPPGMGRRWVIDLSRQKESLRDKPLQGRVKFHSANPGMSSEGAMFTATWVIGSPDSPKLYRPPPQDLPAESFQEFEIPANLLDEDGKLTVGFVNVNDTALLFGLDDGFEVLYPEGSFGLNFVRGLGIILCWLALLATIGLAAASWLSFPVAAFFSVAVLVVGLSSGTLSNAVEQGTILGLNHDTNKPNNEALDSLVMPVFKGLLTVVKLVEGFSPVDSLSTGRSITWGQLGMAATQIVLLLGGIFASIGIVLFSRRELAAVQSSA